MFKRFMRSKFMKVVIGWLVAAYMTFVKYTTRWDVQRTEQIAEIHGNGKGVIALVWHSRFMMLTAAWKKKFQLPYVLISRSHEGDIVAHSSHFLGLKTIRGSTRKTLSQKSKNKGGAQAGRGIIEAIENGGCIVVTPDGPRGPRQRVNAGPLRLARLTGAPLMPCTLAIKNRKEFSTWDKLILPLPFGRGTVLWGTPVYIPEDTSDAEIEIIRLSIEIEMNDFLIRADTELGHEATLPDEIS